LIYGRYFLRDTSLIPSTLCYPGISQHCLPTITYALLQTKTQTTYKTLLRVLEAAECDPSVIIVDFERSVDLAIVSIFGEHVHVEFCFYHLTQSIWRKIQPVRLPNMYETNDDFRLFCGQIDAFVFLLVDEVTDGIIHPKDTAPEKAKILLEYFDSTYVSGQLRSRRHHDGLGLIFWRTPRTFLSYRWHMHEVTIADQLQINNICESWNNRFHTLVGQDYPTIRKLIEILEAECARINGVLIQDEPHKTKKKIKKDLH